MRFAIEKIRTTKGISQVELASKLGITQGAISQWEQEVSYPSTKMLPKIAEKLGCSIEDLFEKADN